MNGDACVSSHVRLERAPYHRKAGNDMDKKGILTVRMMGTISVEYEGELFSYRDCSYREDPAAFSDPFVCRKEGSGQGRAVRCILRKWRVC